MKHQGAIKDIKEKVGEERRIVREIILLLNDLKIADNEEEAFLIISQIDYLKNSLKKTGQEVIKKLESMLIVRPLHAESNVHKEEPSFIQTKFSVEKLNLSEIEKDTLRRLREKEKKEGIKKLKKPSKYIKISNQAFSEIAARLAVRHLFRSFKKDLIKANLQMIPTSYISVMLFTTLLSVGVAILFAIFLLFFNLGIDFPFITKVMEESLPRFLKIFWVILVIPMGTFFLMYIYPSVEKKSIGDKIDYELPFATIHMSAIAGSMIDPSKIFNIIIMTKEYPHMEKEFIKLINEINLYGYDLVTALKHISSNTPSKKLGELLDGLTTTITSGGNLPVFFEKRAETLLFTYKIEKEKRTKSAETFMDIYISVVIAAPMILMLLLMMMKVSGIGLSMSTTMITIIMVLGVTMVNIFFLTFLHVKQPPS